MLFDYMIVNEAKDKAKVLASEILKELVAYGHKAVHQDGMDAEKAYAEILEYLNRRMMDFLTGNCTCLVTIAIRKEVGLCLESLIRQPYFKSEIIKAITGILIR